MHTTGGCDADEMSFVAARDIDRHRARLPWDTGWPGRSRPPLRGAPFVSRPLRIAHVAPPIERVPPRGYGGTERIVHELVVELVRRGHEVTTFASGDSSVPGRHVETVPLALRPTGFGDDPWPYMLATMRKVVAQADEFDIVHSHIEWGSLLLAEVLKCPVVTTFHGRLDRDWARDAFQNPPSGLVAISHNQASTHPDVPFTVIHNGLSLEGAPFDRKRSDALCFVGRVAPEKGIVEAIDIAKQAGRPLRIAAKIGATPAEQAYYENAFRPALEAAGSGVEFLGELAQAERDLLFAESAAALMPGSWPEPFGLVAIEALACGTPVVARRIGALPEIIRDGVDGFFGDDLDQMAFKVDAVDQLDRAEIRRSVLERFSAARMTDDYLALYHRLLGSDADGAPPTAESPEESVPAGG
jgi:glycosyltransferase involved in cell wall biosynthesis